MKLDAFAWEFSPGVWLGLSVALFRPNVNLGAEPAIFFSALSTLYSPGAGVRNLLRAFGRLCSEKNGGVSLPFTPSPITLYCAGPGPYVSDEDRAAWREPKLKAGAACLRESGTFTPAKQQKYAHIHRHDQKTRLYDHVHVGNNTTLWYRKFMTRN